MLSFNENDGVARPGRPPRFLKPHMEFEDPDQICLRGSLILADPSLRDPNFFRTVLLLTEHSTADGAHDGAVPAAPAALR